MKKKLYITVILEHPDTFCDYRDRLQPYIEKLLEQLPHYPDCWIVKVLETEIEVGQK